MKTLILIITSMFFINLSVAQIKKYYTGKVNHNTTYNICYQPDTLRQHSLYYELRKALIEFNICFQENTTVFLGRNEIKHWYNNDFQIFSDTIRALILHRTALDISDSRKKFYPW